MKFDSKNGNLLITTFTILITYIIMKTIYNASGFYYNFDDGISINLIIDLALWIIVYFSVNLILKRLFSK
jgi:hypothetical protein